MSSFTAGVIVIGDEILSGRTQDTNSNYIAKKLLEAGIKLEEVIVIQDDKKTIIENVLKYSLKYSYVFTTGGIGPTHDDITSESISEAFNLQYETNKMAFDILENYYPKGEFNESRQRMAKMPFGSELILNPMTAAPGFIVKNIYVLPGVPEIMQVMFEELMKKIKMVDPKLVKTIKTNLYEKQVSLIHDFAIEKALSLPNPASLTSAKLIIASKNTYQYEEIKEVVSLFQWLLPGLATNVSYLRAQLNGLNWKRK